MKDADVSRSFYASALGLAFEGQEGDYAFTHELEGVKHFGLWPLSEAANACFGARGLLVADCFTPAFREAQEDTLFNALGRRRGHQPAERCRRDNQLMVTLGHGTQDEWR